jgi:hypothetical protein
MKLIDRLINDIPCSACYTFKDGRVLRDEDAVIHEINKDGFRIASRHALNTGLMSVNVGFNDMKDIPIYLASDDIEVTEEDEGFSCICRFHEDCVPALKFLSIHSPRQGAGRKPRKKKEAVASGHED